MRYRQIESEQTLFINVINSPFYYLIVKQSSRVVDINFLKTINLMLMSNSINSESSFYCNSR